MVPDLSQISGIDNYSEKTEKDRVLYQKNGKAFLVVNKHTIEVRCDDKLSQVLKEKYESVMESRYFGRAGLELVPANQLSESEVEDLIGLSYRLTKEAK